jgi:hypothetical protein
MVRVVVTVRPGMGRHTARRISRRAIRRLDVLRRTTPVSTAADLTFAWVTIAGRGGGLAESWTAPPPMIAPPQVQAQSFAKAILTDITSILFLAVAATWKDQNFPDEPTRH